MSGKKLREWWEGGTGRTAGDGRKSVGRLQGGDRAPKWLMQGKDGEFFLNWE